MKRTGVFTALAWVFGTLGAIALLGADAWAEDRADYSEYIFNQQLAATDYSYSLPIGTISNIASTTGTGGAVTATASSNTLTNSKVTLNLTDGIVTGNSITRANATAQGGAAYIDLSGGSNDLTNSTVIINLSDTTFTSNYASGTIAQGGAAYIDLSGGTPPQYFD